MTDIEGNFPKAVDFLPGEKLDLLFLYSLLQENSINQIWIPRYASLEDIDSNEGEIWDLGYGLVPTTGIGKFVIDLEGVILPMELGEESWIATDATKKDDVNAQVFVHQMKSFVDVQRVVLEKQMEGGPPLTDIDDLLE